MSNYLAKYSVEELQGYYSDFHKDLYGYRPRFVLELDSWNDRAYLESAINQMHDEMDKKKETFEGREELREQGWVVEETDPELAKRAKWLADERKRELDDWNNQYDKEYA